MNTFKYFIIVLRIALGLLFVYGGVQKFVPKDRPATTPGTEVPAHVVKIKAFIGGLKQTGYFWPLLGATEILAGLMLISQVLSLLGAVVLLPVNLNIFLFHAFLEPHDTGELAMTSLYLAANLLLIGWAYPKLKPVFLNFQLKTS